MKLLKLVGVAFLYLAVMGFNNGFYQPVKNQIDAHLIPHNLESHIIPLLKINGIAVSPSDFISESTE